MKKALSIILVALLLVTIAACSVRREIHSTLANRAVQDLAVPTPTATPIPTPEPTPVPTPVPNIPFEGGYDMAAKALDTDVFTLPLPKGSVYKDNEIGNGKKLKDTAHNIYVVSKDDCLIANGVDMEAIQDFITCKYALNGTNDKITAQIIEVDDSLTFGEGTSGIRIKIEIDRYTVKYYALIFCAINGDKAVEVMTKSDGDPIVPEANRSYVDDLYECCAQLIFK